MSKSIYDMTPAERKRGERAAKKRLRARGMVFLTPDQLLDGKPNKKLVAAFKQFPHLLPKRKKK